MPLSKFGERLPNRTGVTGKIAYIKWITTEEIDRYDFCPADTVILEKLKKLKSHHKLVQDKIPEMIEAQEKICTCEVLNAEAYPQCWMLS